MPITGPFIYKGAGKVQALHADICQKKCIKQACQIQLCLAKRNHQEKLCSDVIDVWKKCCEDAKHNYEDKE